MKDQICSNENLRPMYDHGAFGGDRRSFSSVMSTDTDDESGVGLGSGQPVWLSQNVSTLLITANVGSIFEDPDTLIPTWQEQVIKHIATSRPQFIAIHFQEVGGKNIHDDMVLVVRSFVDALLVKAEGLGFTKHCGHFDQNFHSPEKFTALGSLYLIHMSLPGVEMFNYKERMYVPLEESVLHIGDIDEVMTLAEKFKFPQQFFPDNRWSRKGFLRSRFRIQNAHFELLNIHLFHDVSNLVSHGLQDTPTTYRNLRKRALKYTLDTVKSHKLPFFIFGDFNFRLEGRAVLERLSSGLSKEKDLCDLGDEELIHFKDNQDQVVLSIGKKEFQVENHDETFKETWIEWTDLDKETDHLEGLTEMKLNFPPTYPFEEHPAGGSRYMRTRCPAWCDRILYSHDARVLIHDYEAAEDNVGQRRDPEEEDNDVDDEEDEEVELRVEKNSVAEYSVVGEDVCMGDHKPVSLRFELNVNVDTSESSSLSEALSSRCPRVESPTYTDLLSNSNNSSSNNTQYQTIMDINSVTQVKMFKETTV